MLVTKQKDGKKGPNFKVLFFCLLLVFTLFLALCALYYINVYLPRLQAEQEAYQRELQRELQRQEVERKKQVAISRCLQTVEKNFEEMRSEVCGAYAEEQRKKYIACSIAGLDPSFCHSFQVNSIYSRTCTLPVEAEKKFAEMKNEDMDACRAIVN